MAYFIFYHYFLKIQFLIFLLLFMPKNYTSNLGIYSQDKNLKSYLQIKPVLHLPHPTPSPQVPFLCLFTVGCVSFQTFSSCNGIWSSYHAIACKPRVCKELLLENHSDSGHPGVQVLVHCDH